MGGRYLVSGAQLGLLCATQKNIDRGKMIKKIMDEQFIEDSTEWLSDDVKKLIKLLKKGE